MRTDHERTRDGKNEWYTPPEIIKALGPFLLDPCTSVYRPWPTAKFHIGKPQNGLEMAWSGRVWCNPPYDGEQEAWLNKCADHGDAIALVFARTDTRWFHRIIKQADAVLFLKNRLRFYHVDGTKADRAGTASMLLAFGEANASDLLLASATEPMLNGIFINTKNIIQP